MVTNILEQGFNLLFSLGRFCYIYVYFVYYYVIQYRSVDSKCDILDVSIDLLLFLYCIHVDIIIYNIYKQQQ